MLASPLRVAIARYEAACLAEDAFGEPDGWRVDFRWEAGRAVYSAEIETTEDALILLRRLDAEETLPAVAMASLIVTLERGAVPSDLPGMRGHVAVIRTASEADALEGDWTEQVTAGMDSLTAFLFAPRLVI